MYFIALVACLSLTGAESALDSTADSDSLLCTPGEHNATVPPLARSRRHLLFEKGSAVTIAVSAVKAIISGIPRGMLMVNEVTLYYELPWLKSQLRPVQPTTPPPRKVTEWKVWPSPEYSFVSPGYAHTRHMHERGAGPEDGFFDLEGIVGIFFQQIRQFAKSYGYNDRHCILRTICDAKHFLYPEGQSLFHDAVRILMDTYLSGGTVGDRKQLAAWSVQNPRDCANLYGPHCRMSFLDHLTRQIYGKLM